MPLESILLHPAGPYTIIALGLTLCLFLFVTLKRDLRMAEARSRRNFKSLDTALKEKEALLDERLDELTRVSGLLVSPEPPRSGLNLTKRSQVLQMHRRGSAPSEIAAALALPQNEVDLLLKVHRIVLSSLTTTA